MLDAFLKYMKQAIGESTRDRVRVINMKDHQTMPGVVNALVVGDDGSITQEKYEVALAPNSMVAKTLRQFTESLVSKMVAEDYEKADIYIGDENIVCYFMVDTDSEYHRMESLTLSLDATQAFEFASNKQVAKATALKYNIMELFTGYDKEGQNPIISLVPLLSKISVSERKSAKQTNTANNNSIGLDVQQDLVLNDNDVIPELVTVPVRVYEQVDYVHQITMLFRYDFDSGNFILSPVQSDVDAACDTTVAYITDIVDKIDLKTGEHRIFPCAITIPSASASI